MGKNESSGRHTTIHPMEETKGPSEKSSNGHMKMELRRNVEMHRITPSRAGRPSSIRSLKWSLETTPGSSLTRVLHSRKAPLSMMLRVTSLVSGIDTRRICTSMTNPAKISTLTLAVCCWGMEKTERGTNPFLNDPCRH